MQSPDKSGIQCDCCGTTLSNDFTYFSLDFKLVVVKANKFPGDWSKAGDNACSVDACPKCMEIISETVKVNFKPTSIGINCELCPMQLRGDFSFYRCRVSKVVVSFSGGSIKCVCGEKMVSPPCRKCNGGQAVKAAKVEVDDEYLLVIVCSSDCEKIMANATRLRSKK